MSTRPAAHSRASRVIRASEIGEYVYCHRAWWLGRVRGIPNANRAALDEGVTHHRAHGQRVRRAQALQRAAVACAALAVGLALWLGLVLLHAH